MSRDYTPEAFQRLMDEFDFLSAAAYRGVEFRVRLIEIIFKTVSTANSSHPSRPPMKYMEMKTRLCSLLNTNSVSAIPPVGETSWSTPIVAPGMNLVDQQRGAAIKQKAGRVRAARRGLPGRGGASVQAAAARIASPDIQGHVPSDYKKFMDSHKRNICVKFNTVRGCNEVRMFWLKFPSIKNVVLRATEVPVEEARM